MNKKILRRIKRQTKITKVLKLNPLPRLLISRSNKYIYAQVIDREGKVIAAASEKELKTKGKKTENAFQLGLLIAQKSQAQKIKQVIFDRRGYIYHGRVRSLADGARKGGLIF